MAATEAAPAVAAHAAAADTAASPDLAWVVATATALLSKPNSADEERFLGLLMVARYGQQLSDAQLAAVFDALDFGFVDRLLASGGAGGDYPYRPLAAAVLAAFATRLPHAAAHRRTRQRLGRLLPLLCAPPALAPVDDDDVLRFALAVVAADADADAADAEWDAAAALTAALRALPRLLSAPPAAAASAASAASSADLAMRLTHLLLLQHRRQAAADAPAIDAAAVQCAIAAAVRRLEGDRTALFFEALHLLEPLLDLMPMPLPLPLPPNAPPDGTADWLPSLRQSLGRALGSRLPEARRHQALAVALAAWRLQRCRAPGGWWLLVPSPAATAAPSTAPSTTAAAPATAATAAAAAASAAAPPADLGILAAQLTRVETRVVLQELSRRRDRETHDALQMRRSTAAAAAAAAAASADAPLAAAASDRLREEALQRAVAVCFGLTEALIDELSRYISAMEAAEAADGSDPQPPPPPQRPETLVQMHEALRDTMESVTQYLEDLTTRVHGDLVSEAPPPAVAAGGAVPSRQLPPALLPSDDGVALAAVRVMGAWTAEDTELPRAVVQVLPLLLALVQAHQPPAADLPRPYPALDYLLPGLLHLTAADADAADRPLVVSSGAAGGDAAGGGVVSVIGGNLEAFCEHGGAEPLLALVGARLLWWARRCRAADALLDDALPLVLDLVDNLGAAVPLVRADDLAALLPALAHLAAAAATWLLDADTPAAASAAAAGTVAQLFAATLGGVLRVVEPRVAAGVLAASSGADLRQLFDALAALIRGRGGGSSGPSLSRLIGDDGARRLRAAMAACGQRGYDAHFDKALLAQVHE